MLRNIHDIICKRHIKTFFKIQKWNLYTFGQRANLKVVIITNPNVWNLYLVFR
jgi:hypothetical protein